MAGGRATQREKPTTIKVETVLGAVLAAVTLVAALLRYVISPQTASDALTAVIAITGPLLALLVLLAALKSLRALLQKPDESFAAVLDRELDEWLDRMKPLVRVKNDYEGTADDDGAVYEMLVQHDAILKRGDDLSAKRYVEFLRLPASFADGRRLSFVLRETMFTRRAEALDEDRGIMTEKLAKDFAATIGQGFRDIVAVHAYPDARVHDTVTVTLRRDLTSAADAHRLISLINYGTLLYLATA